GPEECAIDVDGEKTERARHRRDPYEHSDRQRSMSAPRGCVFRDHVAWVDGAALAEEVARDPRAASDEAGVLRALLSGAALEGALADAGHASGAVTDRI